MVLPYDVFAFTFLQECLAVELGIPVGLYYHNSGSFHYYLDEEPLVRKLLSESVCLGDTSHAVPVMPPEPSPFIAVALILGYEARVRDAVAAGYSADSVPVPALPRYWRDIALLLACGLSQAAGRKVEPLKRELSDYWAWTLGISMPAMVGGVSK
jgi:thymidylate synthase